MPALRPVANVVVALYLLLFVPAFVLLTYVVARGAPRLALASLESFLIQAGRFEDARAAQDLGAGIAAVGQGMLLLLPLFGVALFLVALSRWILGALAKASGRTAAQRMATVVSVTAAIALLFALWRPAVTATVADGRARWERIEPAPSPTISPAPTPTSAEPTASQPRVLSPSVQVGGAATASPVRSPRTMTPIPTATPTPMPTPSSTSPSPTPSASAP